MAQRIDQLLPVLLQAQIGEIRRARRTLAGCQQPLETDLDYASKRLRA